MAKRKDRFVVGMRMSGGLFGVHQSHVYPFNLDVAKKEVNAEDWRGCAIIYELVPYKPKKTKK